MKQSLFINQPTKSVAYYSAPENWHEAAKLFPLMDAQELDALAADIKAHGLQNPIILSDSKVLDGRNRLLACKLAGVEPDFRDWWDWTTAELDPSSLINWVISQNVHRRNLTPSQKALIAVEAEDLMQSLATEAKGRQRMGSEKIPYPDQKGKTTEKAAQLFGTNEKYIRDVKRIKKDSPAMVEQLRSGALSVPCALRQMEWVEGIAEEEAEKVGRKAAKRKKGGGSSVYVSEDFLKRFLDSFKCAAPTAMIRRGRVPEIVIQVAREVVSAGLRTLAAKRHPDHGGSEEDMQTLNAAVQWLKLLISRQESNQ